MEAKKVLFINQEIIPYVPESEMSHLGRLIPQVIQDKGYEIRTFMPNGAILMSAADNCMKSSVYHE